MRDTARESIHFSSPKPERPKVERSAYIKLPVTY